MRTLLQVPSILLLVSLSLGASTGNTTGTVVKSHVSDSADLIELDAGGDAGLRLGMHGYVVRENKAIATLIIVELRPSVSIGLVEVISRDGFLRMGDLVQMHSENF